MDAVLLILVVIQGSLVVPLQVVHDADVRQVEIKDHLSYRLWKRDQSCGRDEYYTGVHCCKNCKEGSYVRSDCEQPHGNPICDECIDGTYMDQENGYKECHRCRDCQAASGEEILHKCTATHNTVCQCAIGFFCKEKLLAPDEGCKQCQHCMECDYGKVEACTPVKDTVCFSRHHNVTYILIALWIIAAVSLIVWGRVQKRKPIQQLPIVPRVPTVSLCPPHLEDINLELHLNEFASIMEIDNVLRLARKRLYSARVEEINVDGRTANDKKYYLLKAWYNDNGRKGAFKCLVDNCDKGTAETLIKIVEGGNAEAPALSIFVYMSQHFLETVRAAYLSSESSW